MEAWLDKFFDCTGSATNWVKKKPTLDHALQHFRARKSDISVFLECQAPPCQPSHFQKAYSKHHPERNNPFGGGRLVGGQGYLVLVEPRGLSHGNR